MGSRAGFIVKRDGVAKAYGSRYAGSSTVSWLLRGPEVATKKFVGEDELEDLDDVLGGEDGAALIDWDDKIVLWSMSNCGFPVQQKLCNRMIAAAFPGWEVRMFHDLYEVTEHVGCDTAKYVTEDDTAETKQYLKENEPLTADNVWQPGEVPDPIRSVHEVENTGVWISLREPDGTIRDYFGLESICNLMLRGDDLIEELQKLPTMDSIPAELVTLDGVFIDCQAKDVWRWHPSRVALVENQYVRAWSGWTLKVVPGNSWSGQVEVTGRTAAGLECDERSILGPTIQDVAPFAVAADTPNVGGWFAKARLGCAGFTLLLVAATIASYALYKSILGVVLFGIMSLLAFAATRFVFRASKNVSKMLDIDANPKETVQAFEKTLVGLGYPTLDQLRESGELTDSEEDEDEEDEE